MKSDLREKYGRSKNTRQLINAAIRAELAGGNQALDALGQLDLRYDLTEGPAGAFAKDTLHTIVDAMAAEIRRRYGLPPREQD
jgi:hypothetical protein